MADDIDPDLRAALGRAPLPEAPASLRLRLQLITAEPPVVQGRVGRPASTRRLVVLLGLAAAVALAAVVMTVGIGRAPVRTAEIPATVDGLAVMTVSEALAAHAAGHLPGGRAAIRGYWSNGSVGHGCSAPAEPVGELELRCIDGEFGITEQEEPIWVVDQFGYVTYQAQGPHLTPWIPSGLEGVEPLSALPIINGQRYPPVPIVVIGHFDDPQAAECRVAARQLCLDRLVLERIVQFDPTSVPTPGVTEAPTPFPSPPPPGLFDAASCAGAIPYAFVGWTTEAELGVDRGYRGHVWAMVTADVIQRTDGWNEDPNGSGHKYQVWARLICWAEENPHGEGGIELGSEPASAYVLWDDGLKVPGEYVTPRNPEAS